MLDNDYFQFRILLVSKLILAPDRNHPSTPTQVKTSKVKLSEVITYIWDTSFAILRPRDCHYFINCPSRALIDPSFSMHFIRVSWWQCGPLKLTGYPSSPLPSDNAPMSVSRGSQWGNEISVWSCVLHLMPANIVLHLRLCNDRNVFDTVQRCAATDNQ